MDALVLLALAIGPCLAIMLYVYLKDRFDKEPRHLLVKMFFLGVFSIIPAIVMELAGEEIFPLVPTDLVSVFLYSFVVVGFSEEVCKYFFLKRYAYHHKAFNEPYDGIVYAVMVGMGFATIENILYVLQGGVGIAFLRMFSAVPAHAIFGILMGYFVGRAKFEEKNDGFALRMMGLLAAIIFHGGYDFFLLQQNYPVFYLGAIVVVFVGVMTSKQAIRIHVNNSPFRRIKRGIAKVIKRK